MSIEPPAFSAPAAEWLVYADQLQERGDLLGELIALNDAAYGGVSVDERDAFVEDHAGWLFGGAVPTAIDVVWGRWLADDLTVRVNRQTDLDIVDALLASPMASATRRFSLAGITEDLEPIDLAAAVASLTRRLPTRCTEVALIDQRARDAATLASYDWAPDQDLVAFGELAGLLAVPHLEHLELHVADPAQLEMTAIEAPGLRSFSLFGLRWPGADDGAPTELCETIGRATWPRLERFAARLPERFVVSVTDNDEAYVRLDRYDQPHHVAEPFESGYHARVPWAEVLAPILANLGGTRLRQLSLHSFVSSGALLAAVIDADLPHLRVLDLSESDLDDGDAAWMLANSESLRHLSELDLSETRITAAMARRLGALAPRVLHSNGSARHRYLVGRE